MNIGPARFLLVFPTYLQLGLSNLFFVLRHRLALRFGLFRKIMPPGTANSLSPIFRVEPGSIDKKSPFPSVLEEANNILSGNVRCFSSRYCHLGSPPDWFLNLATDKRFPDYQKHWSLLNDFNDDFGDIKCIWEVSRFDWALVLARAYCVSGDDRFIHGLNNWIADWTLKNPVNIGPNWKCGQEVGIRVMQVLLTTFLLGQHEKPTPFLIQFVIEHCRRIEPTIRYSIAQDNNHGTSEAAALFIAGSWFSSLRENASDMTEASRWLQLGRKWLENRIAHLVEDDGSFSQYSVNYHRVMLDTVCQAEFWRSLSGEAPFSNTFYRKTRAATRWLYIFTNEKNGDAPNLGANDGARLFNLSSTGFRDYRPTVQLASQIFYGSPVYPLSQCDESLYWLAQGPYEPDCQLDELPPICKESTLFEQGGYCYLVEGSTEIFIRFPRFRFRPGHADALHLDLWHKGLNVIRDGGSYSYNAAEPWMSYFSGTRAHSTVEFDGRDQMPRIGRFLFGYWLKTSHLSSIKNVNGKLVWSAGYKDYKGAEHDREVMLKGNRVTIKDTLKGFRKSGTIRWRLAPENWKLNDYGCSSKIASLKVSANVTLQRFELVEGFESRYYMEKTSLPVLEIEVNKDAEVITEITLSSSVLSKRLT